MHTDFTIEENQNEKNQRYTGVNTVVEHFIRLCHRHRDHDRIFELTRDRPDFEDLVAREMVHIVPIIRHKLFLDWNFFITIEGSEKLTVEKNRKSAYFIKSSR